MHIGRLNVQTAGSLPLIAGHWTGCFDCATYCTRCYRDKNNYHSHNLLLILKQLNDHTIIAIEMCMSVIEVHTASPPPPPPPSPYTRGTHILDFFYYPPHEISGSAPAWR